MNKKIRTLCALMLGCALVLTACGGQTKPASTGEGQTTEQQPGQEGQQAGQEGQQAGQKDQQAGQEGQQAGQEDQQAGQEGQQPETGKPDESKPEAGAQPEAGKPGEGTGTEKPEEPEEPDGPMALSPEEEEGVKNEEEEDLTEETGGNPACRLFSLTIPEQYVGHYVALLGKNNVAVFDKDAREAGFGGFVFAVYAYKDPADYAGMPAGRKIGELTGGDGTLYDVVIGFPTDVQFDIEGGESATYKGLANESEEIAKTLTSTDGGTFAYGAGIKGEDLYPEILSKHVTAITEEWDNERLEQENMSIIYALMRSSAKSADEVLERVSYAYLDINADGIDELLIGEIGEGEWKNVVYDIYTISDRKPVHVVSGWDRSRYYICEGDLICNEYSGSASESCWDLYYLLNNTPDLSPSMAFKTETGSDGTRWLIAYSWALSNERSWESFPEDEWNERFGYTVDRRIDIDYKPLSEAK